MLEEPSFQNVVSWGPLGDCFVVKVCLLFFVFFFDHVTYVVDRI